MKHAVEHVSGQFRPQNKAMDASSLKDIVTCIVLAIVLALMLTDLYDLITLALTGCTHRKHITDCCMRFIMKAPSRIVFVHFQHVN